MTDPMDRLSAALAQRYRIERELGAGGMATVYLARDLKHDRQVAIKVLHPDLSAVLGAERFLGEIKLTANLHHPNILPLFDSGEAEGVLYYIMPFVEGRTLRDRLNTEKQLPIDESLQIAQEVASALDYAHRQGLVHRDIKPENILLHDGHALVADFGLAIAISAAGGERLTQTGLAVGTPQYMSPEQGAGESNLGPSSDIYALGCVLYEMLAGAVPFTGADARAVIARHSLDPVPQISTVRPSVPPGIEAAVQQALQKAPVDRFGTASEFADQLRTPSHVDTTKRSIPNWVRRSFVPLVVGALIAGVFFVFSTFRASDDPRRSMIVFPFEVHGTAEQEWLRDASLNSLSLALAHWEDLRVFDDERTSSLLRRQDLSDRDVIDFEVARRLARESDIGTFILGDIRPSTDSTLFEAKVYDTRSGDRVATETTSIAENEDPRIAFDALAAQILGVSGGGSVSIPGVVTQTTASLEAYRAFLVGTDALFQFQFDSADTMLERAIALDSTFALAHLMRARAEAWRPARGNAAIRRRHIFAAQLHGSTLSPRQRRSIEIADAELQGDWNRVRTLAGEQLALDSLDVEAWHELGEGHYHGGATRYVDRSSAEGDLGLALQAFRRATALDSSHFLSYTHMIDIFRVCVNAAYPVACRDNQEVVYGPVDSLISVFGEQQIEQWRATALERGVNGAQAWAEAAPTSPQPIRMLTYLYLDADRFEDASRAAGEFRTINMSNVAASYEAQAMFGQRRFREAAQRMNEAVLATPDAEIVSELSMFGSSGLLAAAGRVEDAMAVQRRFYNLNPSFFGFFVDARGRQIFWPTPVWSDRALSFFSAAASLDSARLASSVRPFLTELRNQAESEEQYQAIMGRMSPLMNAFLVTRDTTLITTLLRDADTVLWKGAEAQLALARGDTTTAANLLRQHYTPNAPLPTGPFQFSSYTDYAVDLFAWADLLSQLGRRQDALRAYERFDELDLDPTADLNGSLVILAWAERAALHQSLGDSTRAIQLYERFVRELSDADSSVRVLVDRAQQSLASLKGFDPARF